MIRLFRAGALPAGNVSEVFRRGNHAVVAAEGMLLVRPIEREAGLVVLANGMVPGADPAAISARFDGVSLP
jgi:heterodisulfide reductase subunit A-like polyferredoxin